MISNPMFRRRVAAAAVAGALATLSQGAFAHRTYNVTGFAGTLDPLFTLSGLDGFGLPAPQYAGGSGPNATTTGNSFYQGALPVHWMTALHAAANEAGEIFDLSTADALTASASTPGNFLLGASGSTFGTGLDFGYIRVDNPQFENGHGVRVTVSADATLGSTLKPTVALFAGWDHSWSGATGAVKAAAGGSSPAQRIAPYAPVDGALSSDLVLVQAIPNAPGVDTVSLFFQTALAASHYTLVIGGTDGSSGAYRVTVETVQVTPAPVPLPAPVLLLGSALGALCRRGRHS
ncbi:MAG: hypothetical protein AB7O21_14825 [Gammaproteobacteria bacterium]